MARRRVDTAPQFNVGADSVLIQQVVGSTSNIFEVKNHSGASVMAIDSSGATTATFAAGVGLPVGMITPFAGSTAPTGWLLCYGQAVSRTTYAALFAVLSTTYNTGVVAETDFCLPDLRGRTVAGIDNMGGTDALRLDIANSSGTVIGSQYVTLTSAQSGVPAHAHANTASFSGSFTGTGSTTGNDSPDHSHSGTTSMNAYTDFLRVVGVAGTTMENNHAVGRGGGSYADHTGSYPNHQHNFSTGGASARHAHSFTPAGSISGSVTMSNQPNTAASAAESHSVMQPTMVLNYIVRY
jgi:microcystin-dependent protein